MVGESADKKQSKAIFKKLLVMKIRLRRQNTGLTDVTARREKFDIIFRNNKLKKKVDWDVKKNQLDVKFQMSLAQFTSR